jgi:hypothetical protein
VRFKSRTKKGKPKLPSSQVPLRCLVLAVDPGERCGWAIYHRGAYVDSGHLHGYDPAAIAEVIRNAQFFASTMHRPLVLVLEKPPKGGAAFAGRSPAGPASVIGCRKLWQHVWRERGGKKRFRIDVYPVSWRARVLGMTSGPLLKRMERLRANELAGKDVMSHDEAVAILIGTWGSYAGEVGFTLGGVIRPTEESLCKST